MHKLFAGISTGINFAESSKLRVRAEEQIDAAGGPLQFAGVAIASFVRATIPVGSGLPLRVHVEQVYEEVIRQRLRTLREHPVLRVPEVCIEHAKTTDEHRHFRSGESEQLRAVQ